MLPFGASINPTRRAQKRRVGGGGEKVERERKERDEGQREKERGKRKEGEMYKKNAG